MSTFKFKVGDRVKLIDNFRPNKIGDVQKGDTATVYKVVDTTWMFVRFDRKTINHSKFPQRHDLSWQHSQFELLEPQFSIDFQTLDVDEAIKVAEIVAAHLKKPVHVKSL